MEIDIATLNFDLTPGIAEYADRRVFAACIVAAKVIEGAIVRLWEVNAHRGGNSKACRIRACFPQRTTLVVEAIDGDLYSAIDTAAARFRRALYRHIQQRRTAHGDYAPPIGHNPIKYSLLMVEGHHDYAAPNPDRN